MTTFFRLVVATLAFCVAVGVSPANAQEQAPAEPWSFSVSVNGSYEENALFVGPTEDQKEFVHDVQGTLGRTWTLRRGNAQASLRGSQPFYRETASLNDFSYSVNGGMSYALTHRLSWSGSSALSSGLARQAEVLTEAGQVLPSTTVRSTTSASMFSYALSRRSQLGWTLSQQGVDFASAFFAGGSTVGSTTNWSRQMTAGQVLALTHGYQRTSGTVASQSIHSIAASWNTSFRHWAVSASAGAAPYTVADQPGYRVSSIFSASVTRPVRRGHSLAASYSKSVQYAFGTASENRPTQTLSLTYALPLASKLSASISGSYARSLATTFENADQLSIGQFGSAALTYALAPNFGISFGTTGFRRRDGDEPYISSYRMTLGVTYGTTWR
jgi:hypothetical protein